MDTTIQDLPSEIFFRIFMYLPATDLILSASRVCIQWHEISVDECIWKYHCLSRWGYMKHTQEQTQNYNSSWLSFFKFYCVRSNLSFLILGAEGGGLKDERLSDVQNKLKEGGLVNVEIFNVRSHTPSPDFLRKFNAIMFFSYHGFDQVSVGNLLADFVDMGGGVVFCAYGNCGRGNKLDGKWAAKKYDPLTLGATSRSPFLSLGKINVEKHPILENVGSFDGGEQSSHGDGEPHSEGKVVAEWCNGRPLIVELKTKPGSPHTRRGGEIIGLNLYPPSSDAASGGWNSKTHGARLMANALHYVAGGK